MGDKIGIMMDPPVPAPPPGMPPALSLDDQVAALARATLLRDVEPQQLRLLAFSATERHAATGEVIARAGDDAAPAFLVTAGAVETGGRRHAPGALLNAAGALSASALAHDIVAAVPSRLVLIERALVSRLIREYPAMGRAMLRTQGGALHALAATIRRTAARA